MASIFDDDQSLDELNALADSLGGKARSSFRRVSVSYVLEHAPDIMIDLGEANENKNYETKSKKASSSSLEETLSSSSTTTSPPPLMSIPSGSTISSTASRLSPRSSSSSSSTRRRCSVKQILDNQQGTLIESSNDDDDDGDEVEQVPKLKIEEEPPLAAATLLRQQEQDDAKEAALVDGIDANKVTPTSTQSAQQIDAAYDKTTAQGSAQGLFRASMNEIRKGHKEARNVRTALILLGLFTDQNLYREWIATFYAVNKELERHMQSDDFLHKQSTATEKEVLVKLRELGDTYYFNDLYEQDLTKLYEKDQWQAEVKKCLDDTPNARAFVEHVRNMSTASELAGALFILWGVYIVGGGAMARQRAVKMAGPDCVNVYNKVSGAGRAQRKAAFIAFWDDLSTTGAAEFDSIVTNAGTCMNLANAMMKDLSANPYWLKWVMLGSGTLVLATGAALVAVAMARIK